MANLVTMSHDANQIGKASLPVPASNALLGLALPIQGLSVELGSRTTLTFTNNAWLRVKATNP